jgi:beta-galactosidase
MRVNVYTKHCDSVLLLLNGKQLGAPSPVSADSQYTATFNGVAYTPGNLTAVGLRNGSACAQKTLLTAGVVASLKLTADRATIYHHRNDLAFVTVTALDSNGIEVPDTAGDWVTFTLSDSTVEIAAVGSGDPRDVSSLKNSSNRSLWRGKALVILRPTTGATPGAVELTVSAAGLPKATLSIRTKPVG